MFSFGKNSGNFIAHLAILKDLDRAEPQITYAGVLPPRCGIKTGRNERLSLLS